MDGSKQTHPYWEFLRLQYLIGLEEEVLSTNQTRATQLGTYNYVIPLDRLAVRERFLWNEVERNDGNAVMSRTRAHCSTMWRTIEFIGGINIDIDTDKWMWLMHLVFLDDHSVYYTLWHISLQAFHHRLHRFREIASMLLNHPSPQLLCGLLWWFFKEAHWCWLWFSSLL